MPTYQYACTECGHRLEAIQSFTDDPLTECTECGGRLRKVFNSVGIVFKGSGFYRNDSREKPTKSEKAPSGASVEKADAKSESKSDSGSGTKGEGSGASSAAPSKTDSPSGKKSESGSSTAGSAA